MKYLQNFKISDKDWLTRTSCRDNHGRLLTAARSNAALNIDKLNNVYRVIFPHAIKKLLWIHRLLLTIDKWYIDKYIE